MTTIDEYRHIRPTCPLSSGLRGKRLRRNAKRRVTTTVTTTVYSRERKDLRPCGSYVCKRHQKKGIRKKASEKGIREKASEKGIRKKRSEKGIALFRKTASQHGNEGIRITRINQTNKKASQLSRRHHTIKNTAATE
jgi:hypothetical protein